MLYQRNVVHLKYCCTRRDYFLSDFVRCINQYQWPGCMKNKCDDYQSEIVHCLGRDLFQKVAANYVLACWSAFDAIVAKIDTHRIRHTATFVWHRQPRMATKVALPPGKCRRNGDSA